MKIYILADMEGISGIRLLEQVQRDAREYGEGRELMMQDINVAIEAAFEAGATEVVACDTHAGGGQMSVAQMDGRAVYETPNCGRMMPSLDESFAGVILLGHHARAGTLNGFLDHTMSSASWFEYRINGQVVGEIGIEAAYAGHYDVPVIAVSGDEAACQEAQEVLGKVECAVVKWGIGRNRATCLSLPQAHEKIRQAIAIALTSIDDYRPYKPALPATVRLTLYRSDMADTLAIQPGVTRIDARTVEKTVDSLLQIKGW
ncbi:MAG: M55 family metallopeptidase [Armatimonadota bacterium]|nr:M55 family metallopeptidase [Armatimonadota bacterium]